MIVVIGNPVGRRTKRGIEAGGIAVAIARAAALGGARVELVGKAGDGPDGDAILLSVARDGVGHVAVIRSVGAAAIDEATPEADANVSLDALAGLDHDGQDGTDGRAWSDDPSAGPGLDAGDLELALRYLPDYRVVVIAQPLDEAGTAAVADAARWANARVIAIAAGADASLPADTTVLEPPDEDAEGGFAAVVGRYAAALDRGEDPHDAFATASRDLGWTPVGED